MRFAKIDCVLAVMLTALTVFAAACGSSSSSTASRASCRHRSAKGEGQLNLVAWEGYAQPEWVKPFEAADRVRCACEVRRLL